MLCLNVAVNLNCLAARIVILGLLNLHFKEVPASWAGLQQNKLCEEIISREVKLVN